MVKNKARPEKTLKPKLIWHDSAKEHSVVEPAHPVEGRSKNKGYKKPKSVKKCKGTRRMVYTEETPLGEEKSRHNARQRNVKLDYAKNMQNSFAAGVPE